MATAVRLGVLPAPLFAGLVMAGSAWAQAPSRVFDGGWKVTLICEQAKDALPFRWVFPATVTDGHLHGVRGVEGQPASMVLDGPIAADGSANLSASGYTGPAQYNVGHYGYARPFAYHVTAKFEPRHGEGRRIEARSCSLDFARP